MMSAQSNELEIAQIESKKESAGQEKLPSSLSFAQVMSDSGGKTGQKPDSSGKFALPGLDVVDGRDFTPIPWDVPADKTAPRMHMEYQQQKDTRVKMGEGPYQVSRRLLGDQAKEGDVKLLTTAVKAQYRDEHKDDPNLENLGVGQALVSEDNIKLIMNRISDTEARRRIENCLKPGWSEKAQPSAIPFDHDARESETQPSFIEDPGLFLKDIAAAAIDVDAAGYRSRGSCAQGARLAFNELPLWHIEGGKVDKPMSKDPEGWRSGIRLATDLQTTGLFETVPLKEIGIKNLKEGYILGRLHKPEYVKDHPSWEGEDFGDIDIVTRKHKPEDDGDRYRDSFVLIPKKGI